MSVRSTLRKVFSASWGEILPLLSQMSHDSSRSRLNLLLDMHRCNNERGINWGNYASAGFYLNQDPAYRATFLSQREMTKLMYLSNTREAIDLLTDKGAAARHLRPFIKRQFVDLRVNTYEEFEALVRSSERIFTKPFSEAGGHGISSYQTADLLTDLRTFYEKFKADGHCIVEEGITQHPDMARLSVKSVNTVRILTCMNQTGAITIPYQSMRISLTDAPVDNASQGGAYVSLDPNGRVKGPFMTYTPSVKFFESNPLTGFSFEGFQVPNFEAAKALALQAASSLPNAKLIGWDIAITPDGADIVEANCNPSPDLGQPFISLPEKHGVKQAVLSALGRTLDET